MDGSTWIGLLAIMLPCILVGLLLIYLFSRSRTKQ